MKKLLLLTVIILPIMASAQTGLDTIRVRHLQLQAQDWAYLVGKNEGAINKDSANSAAFRKIRTAVQAVQNPQWTTNITIDSIPGYVVMAFYQTAKTASAGEIVSRYMAIVNAISAKTVLLYWVGRVDEAVSQDYNRMRDKGKNILLDQ